MFARMVVSRADLCFLGCPDLVRNVHKPFDVPQQLDNIIQSHAPFPLHSQGSSIEKLMTIIWDLVRHPVEAGIWNYLQAAHQSYAILKFYHTGLRL